MKIGMVGKIANRAHILASTFRAIDVQQCNCGSFVEIQFCPYVFRFETIVNCHIYNCQGAMVSILISNYYFSIACTQHYNERLFRNHTHCDIVNGDEIRYRYQKL